MMRNRLLAITISVLCWSFISPANAGQPKGEYQVFTECPLDSNTGLSLCVFSDTGGGGEFTIGRRAVPIRRLVLQSGATPSITTNWTQGDINAVERRANLRKAANKPILNGSTTSGYETRIFENPLLPSGYTHDSQGESHIYGHRRLLQSCRAGGQC